MILDRRLARIRRLPPPAPGQFGPDHTAIEVIRPGEWADADPFILLMDDRADGRLEAGPHPHAGFETVTFLVDGDMQSEHHGAPRLSPGDVEWTTAGSGIVHGPDEPIVGKMRVLQLWLTLPKAQRWTEPDHQFIRAKDAPVRTEPGATATLYSGSTGDRTSPTRNRVPVTLLDLSLQPGADFTQIIPASHNGFLYPLDGELRVGPDQKALVEGDIGWLDRVEVKGDTALRISNPTGKTARVLIYTGERQNIPIAWYGPFIGDTQEDIVRSFERYRSGTFRRV